MVNIHQWQLLKEVFLRSPSRASIFLYINDLTENLDLNPKLFVDGASLFSIADNLAQYNSQLSFDLTKTNNRAYKLKMSINPNHTKPAHGVVFSRTKSETYHPLLMINNVPTKRVLLHTHFRLILECFTSALPFNDI